MDNLDQIEDEATAPSENLHNNNVNDSGRGKSMLWKQSGVSETAGRPYQPIAFLENCDDDNDGEAEEATVPSSAKEWVELFLQNDHFRHYLFNKEVSSDSIFADILPCSMRDEVWKTIRVEMCDQIAELTKSFAGESTLSDIVHAVVDCLQYQEPEDQLETVSIFVSLIRLSADAKPLYTCVARLLAPVISNMLGNVIASGEWSLCCGYLLNVAFQSRPMNVEASSNLCATPMLLNHIMDVYWNVQDTDVQGLLLGCPVSASQTSPRELFAFVQRTLEDRDPQQRNHSRLVVNLGTLAFACLQHMSPQAVLLKQVEESLRRLRPTGMTPDRPTGGALSQALSTAEGRSDLRTYCLNSMWLYCMPWARTCCSDFQAKVRHLNILIDRSFEPGDVEIKKSFVPQILMLCPRLWSRDNDWLFANELLLCFITAAFRGLVDSAFAVQLGGRERILVEIIPGLFSRIGRVWTDQKTDSLESPLGKEGPGALQKRVLEKAFVLARLVVTKKEWTDKVFAIPADNDFAGLFSFILELTMDEWKFGQAPAWVPGLERRMVELASNVCLMHEKFDLALFTRWLKLQKRVGSVPMGPELEQLVIQMVFASPLMSHLRANSMRKLVVNDMTFEAFVNACAWDVGCGFRPRISRREPLFGIFNEDLGPIVEGIRTQETRDVPIKAEQIHQRCMDSLEVPKACFFKSAWYSMVFQAYKDSGRNGVESLLRPIATPGSDRFQLFVETLAPWWTSLLSSGDEVAEAFLIEVVIQPALASGRRECSRLLADVCEHAAFRHRTLSIPRKRMLMSIVATALPLFEKDVEREIDFLLQRVGKARFPKGTRVKRVYGSIVALSSVLVVPRLVKNANLRRIWLPRDLIRKLWTFFVV